MVRAYCINDIMKNWPRFIRSFFIPLLRDVKAPSKESLIQKFRKAVLTKLTWSELIAAEDDETKKLVGLAGVTNKEVFTSNINQIEFAIVHEDHRRQGIYKLLDKAARRYFKETFPEGKQVTMTRSPDVISHRITQGWIELDDDFSTFPGGQKKPREDKGRLFLEPELNNS